MAHGHGSWLMSISIKNFCFTWCTLLSRDGPTPPVLVLLADVTQHCSGMVHRKRFAFAGGQSWVHFQGKHCSGCVFLGMCLGAGSWSVEFGEHSFLAVWLWAGAAQVFPIDHIQSPGWIPCPILVTPYMCSLAIFATGTLSTPRMGLTF